MKPLNIRAVGRWTLVTVVTLVIAVYGYFAVSYRNVIWAVSGPNQISRDERTYKPSMLESGAELPPRDDGRTYVEIDRISPLRWPLYGLKDVDGQMNIYLLLDGVYKAYGIEGGPP